VSTNGAERGERRSLALAGVDLDVDVDMRGQRRFERVRAIAIDEIGVERAVARLATRQDGVVSRAQLLRLGLSREAVDRRLARGALIVLFRSVYAVGHAAVSERGWMRAALLAVGADAVLSHTTAARAWRLVLRATLLHVTVAGRAPRSRAGLQVHGAAVLDARDRCTRGGLPLTSPARTLLDLAATARACELEAALREARVQRLVDDAELAATMGRAPARHPGLTALRRAMASDETAPTRSALERAFLRLVARAGLSAPEVNVSHGGTVIDFLWPREGVLVEVDGWAAHGSRAAFEADRARDADRQAEGLAVLRFTWRQVTGSGLRVIARVAQTLGTRGGRR
jgi:very-short-patch-repair endonuclease